MEELLKKIKKQALEDFADIKDSKALKDIQEKYFNKKNGEFNKALKELKNIANELKPKLGALAQTIKTELQEILEEKKIKFGGVHRDDENDFIDPTINIDRYKIGNLHPMTTVIRDLEDTFKSMGFMVLDGPELESDFYNFEALNIPYWHPARDTQDTFYVQSENKSNIVLRTHTSNVQVRAMQKYGAPLKMVSHGRVFRNEATDASHDHTFYQIEGLMIDKDISIANLIATLKELVSGIYKKDMDVRLRPGYFPFVEPGFELDMSCAFCDKKGCSVCKHTGWIEMGGSGIVHPNVLKAGGIDPKVYSGFAFGMGVTRLLMMKYRVDDIRLLQSGDLRFLKQF